MSTNNPSLIPKTIELEKVIDLLLEIMQYSNFTVMGKNHALAVCELSLEIGKRIKLCQKNLELLRISALLHDFGKITVPNKILLKTASLSPQEFATLKQYPITGAKLARKILSEESAKILYYSKENWDGTGYPDKLKGNNIPLSSRIISLVEAFYSMQQSKLGWKEGKTKNEALEIIKQEAGTKFDPELVKILVDIIQEKPKKEIVQWGEKIELDSSAIQRFKHRLEL